MRLKVAALSVHNPNRTLSPKLWFGSRERLTSKINIGLEGRITAPPPLYLSRVLRLKDRCTCSTNAPRSVPNFARQAVSAWPRRYLAAQPHDDEEGLRPLSRVLHHSASPAFAGTHRAASCRTRRAWARSACSFPRREICRPESGLVLREYPSLIPYFLTPRGPALRHGFIEGIVRSIQTGIPRAPSLLPTCTTFLRGRRLRARVSGDLRTRLRALLHSLGSHPGRCGVDLVYEWGMVLSRRRDAAPALVCVTMSSG